MRQQLPAHLRKNYVILTPRKTHFRPATCAEVQCRGYTVGWETHLDEATVSGADHAAWIRGRECGRTFTEWRAEGSTITVFRFGPGQRPFGVEHTKHVTPLDRPAIFGVRDLLTGPDLVLHRGSENGALDWVDDFANNQITLADNIEKRL